MLDEVEINDKFNAAKNLGKSLTYPQMGERWETFVGELQEFGYIPQVASQICENLWVLQDGTPEETLAHLYEADFSVTDIYALIEFSPKGIEFYDYIKDKGIIPVNEQIETWVAGIAQQHAEFDEQIREGLYTIPTDGKVE